MRQAGRHSSFRRMEGLRVVLSRNGLQLHRLGRSGGSSGTESRGRTTCARIKPSDSGIRSKTGPAINQGGLISGAQYGCKLNQIGLSSGSVVIQGDRLRNERTVESYGSMSLVLLVTSFGSRVGARMARLVITGS